MAGSGRKPRRESKHSSRLDSTEVGAGYQVGRCKIEYRLLQPSHLLLPRFIESRIRMLVAPGTIAIGLAMSNQKYFHTTN
jgi:hypothetical protein